MTPSMALMLVYLKGYLPENEKSRAMRLHLPCNGLGMYGPCAPTHPPPTTLQLRMFSLVGVGGVCNPINQQMVHNS